MLDYFLKKKRNRKHSRRTTQAPTKNLKRIQYMGSLRSLWCRIFGHKFYYVDFHPTHYSHHVGITYDFKTLEGYNTMREVNYCTRCGVDRETLCNNQTKTDAKQVSDLHMKSKVVSTKLLNAYSRLEDYAIENQSDNDHVCRILAEIEKYRLEEVDGKEVSYEN
jgi:hypothetical protein